MNGYVNNLVVKAKIKHMTDGKLINEHGYQLYIAIKEDWKSEPYTYLDLLGAELQKRNQILREEPNAECS